MQKIYLLWSSDFFLVSHQLGLQDSSLHMINGIMVLLSFFTCRIALFPYMYWAYGRHYALPLYGVPFHLSLSCNLGVICILAPQMYWFVLLCRKGYRLYQRQGRAPQPLPGVTDNSKGD